jgi:hypothetical protein
MATILAARSMLDELVTNDVSLRVMDCYQLEKVCAALLMLLL